ncbi:hypothetical protein BJX99DRAFT_109076 [Aspergillus californicus]
MGRCISSNALLPNLTFLCHLLTECLVSLFTFPERVHVFVMQEPVFAFRPQEEGNNIRNDGRVMYI